MSLKKHRYPVLFLFGEQGGEVLDRHLAFAFAGIMSGVFFIMPEFG